MNVTAMFAAPMLLLAANATSAQAPAQMRAQTHEHQAPSQQTAEGRCYCEEMMRKMMSQMMQKQQGMGMAQPTPQADQQPPAAPEHQHQK